MEKNAAQKLVEKIAHSVKRTDGERNSAWIKIVLFFAYAVTAYSVFTADMMPLVKGRSGSDLVMFAAAVIVLALTLVIMAQSATFGEFFKVLFIGATGISLALALTLFAPGSPHSLWRLIPIAISMALIAAVAFGFPGDKQSSAASHTKEN